MLWSLWFHHGYTTGTIYHDDWSKDLVREKLEKWGEVGTKTTISSSFLPSKVILAPCFPSPSASMYWRPSTSHQPQRSFSFQCQTPKHSMKNLIISKTAPQKIVGVPGHNLRIHPPIWYRKFSKPPRSIPIFTLQTLGGSRDTGRCCIIPSPHKVWPSFPHGSPWETTQPLQQSAWWNC